MGQGSLLGDGDGYGAVMGYRGPKLSELLSVEVKPVRRDLRRNDVRQERARGGADP